MATTLPRPTAIPACRIRSRSVVTCIDWFPDCERSGAPYRALSVRTSNDGRGRSSCHDIASYEWF
jgi:hypothetical protein